MAADHGWRGSLQEHPGSFSPDHPEAIGEAVAYFAPAHQARQLAGRDRAAQADVRIAGVDLVALRDRLGCRRASGRVGHFERLIRIGHVVRCEQRLNSRTKGWSRDITDGVVSDPADGITKAAHLGSRVECVRAYHHKQAILQIPES